MENRLIIIAVVSLLCGYLCIHLFNYYSPWLAILLFIVWIIGLFKFTQKQIKNEKKN